MNEMKVLTCLELRSSFGINKFLHTKDKKQRKRFIMLGVAWAFVAAIMIFYVAGLVYGLCLLGLSDIVPSYLAFISSVLIFIFGIFKVGGSLFSSRGYDILSSMPIKPHTICISRFAAMYIEDLVFSSLIMISGMTVYLFLAPFNVLTLVSAAVGVLLVPAIPVVLSVLVGTLICAISVRSKHKSMIQALLVVLLTVGIIGASFTMQDFSASTEVLVSLAENIAALFEKAYPPSVWLGAAILGDALSLCLFAVVSLLSVALCLAVLVRVHKTVMHGLLSVGARHDYKLKKLSRKSALTAMYKREVKRYFSSTVYVTNTVLGPIFGAVMSVALYIVGVDTVAAALPFDIRPLVPFAVAAVFCMMTTTSCAISMEGKQIDIVKSLPISAKTFFDCKILLNLTLMLPCWVISEIFLIMALKPTPAELLRIVLIPLSLMLFSIVFGIFVNLKFHSFDWEKEEQVVKQSMSAMLGGFFGVIVSLLLGVAACLMPQALSYAFCIGACALLAVLTVLLYRKNNKFQMQEL